MNDGAFHLTARLGRRIEGFGLREERSTATWIPPPLGVDLRTAQNAFRTQY
jgi:hypothetical protein